MRRAFLFYLERVRALAARMNLHYNTWYDLGAGSPFNEDAALDVITSFTRELTTKRGVQLNSYLMDDGWDDHKSLWQFHKGWPHGFSRLSRAANTVGSSIGAWLSPWGGAYVVAAGVRRPCVCVSCAYLLMRAVLLELAAQVIVRNT